MAKTRKGAAGPKTAPTPTPYDEGLHFCPLGGSEQFGVNLNLYMCDGRWLLADCGIGFADDTQPGVDILLPDPTYIERNPGRLEALIVTHAHEDHVGATAYLWERLGRPPIYCTAFTEAILYNKFRDRGVRGAPVTIVRPGSTSALGPFAATCVPVAHSIPEAVGLIIDTPRGRVYHSADWNLDPTPPVGWTTDEGMLKRAGDEGVLAYIGDSTNAQVEGTTPSEAEVYEGLLAAFKKCKHRIAVTGFSSNIGRVVNVARAAHACGRKVCVVGRSFHKMIAAAEKLGYMDGVPAFLAEDDLERTARDKIVLLVTGSQGEERAALTRIAGGNFAGVRLEGGDTVIYSSRMIPGNEKAILRVQNLLAQRGVAVVTPAEAEGVIHVSGHPRQGDIARMYDLLRPAIVVPVHGEPAMLEAQAALARARKKGPKVIVPANGAVIRLDGDAPGVVGEVPTGLLAVEVGGRIIDAEHAAIGERRRAAAEGVVHISLVLDRAGALLGEPRVDTIGLLDDRLEGDADILDDLYDAVEAEVAGLSDRARADDEKVEDAVARAAKAFFRRAMKVRPQAIVHVLRV
jgi:ribonuclease J